MRRASYLTGFRGLWTTSAPSIPEGYASDMQNVRVSDGAIRPRYGYRTTSPAPSIRSYAFGMNFLSGYDASYANQQEFVAIVRVDNDPARPFSIHPTTGTRTEITDGGVSVDLHQSPWKGIVFSGDSYWTNPNNSPSVYKHAIGDMESWSEVATDALEAPTGIEITPIQDLGGPVSFASATYDAPVAPVSAIDPDEGGVKMTHTAVGAASVEIHLASPVDWTYLDAFVVKWQSDSEHGFLNTLSSIEVQDSSGETLAAGASRMEPVKGEEAYNVYFDYKDRTANWDQVQTLVLSYTVLPGVDWTYFSMEAMGIDLAYGYETGDERTPEYLTFGVAYYDSVSGDRSRVVSADTPVSYYGKKSRDNPTTMLRRMAYPRLSFNPSSEADKARLYIKDTEGEWRQVAEVNDTASPYTFRLSHSDVLALDEYDEPVFKSFDIVSAFPFQGWVCWLYKGGFQNVRHSKVGDPEAQYDVDNDTDEDLTRGATFSMADDFGDEPVDGIAIGNACFLFGSRGVYAQVGNAPSLLTPTRRVVGAPGLANRFAHARLNLGGMPGVAYVDKTGESVWFLGQQQAFDTDAQGKPVELTAGQRGMMKTYLLEPGAEMGLDAGDIRMDVDENEGSLWIALGNRAIVLRPEHPSDGRRTWEHYRYTLGEE
jgi:hypothetical protein